MRQPHQVARDLNAREMELELPFPSRFLPGKQVIDWPDVVQRVISANSF
jgi:hypothetical protein